MKQKTFKKTDTIWTVVIAAPALLLVVALLVGVFGRTKAEYISAPSTACDDFGGVMLSDYDNLSIAVSERNVTFNFGNIKLKTYDFVVLDVMNAKIFPGDTHTVSFGPVFDFEGSESFFENISQNDPVDYSNISGPFVDHQLHNDTLTYVLDLRNIEAGDVTWYTFVNGEFHKSDTVSSVNVNTTFKSFKIDFQHEMTSWTDTYEIGALYLYGFENAKNCTIGDYIEDQTLNLSTCKDSMLYQGE